MTQLILRGLCLALIAFCPSAMASSVLAYDNINRTNPNEPYHPYGNWIGQLSADFPSTTNIFGTTFTPTIDGMLTSFEVGIFGSVAIDSGLTWSIYSSDGTSSDLGPQLWSQNYIEGVSPQFGTIAQFEVDQGIVLTSGMEYWLVADVSTAGDTSLSWYANNTGAVGDVRWDFFSFSTGESGELYFQDAEARAMAFYVVPVPVPPALLLFASANLFLVGRKFL